MRIGYVAPRTGPLAPFSAPDEFVLQGIRRAIGSSIDVAGSRYPLEILARDSGSSPKRAGTLTDTLISRDRVDLMLAVNTPDTTNPVADRCEAQGIPCVTTLVPWQPWFYPRGGDFARGFQWTYHFFFGFEDMIAVFLDMWGQFDTNRIVAGLWPNDTDGLALSDPARGFPPDNEQGGISCP